MVKTLQLDWSQKMIFPHEVVIGAERWFISEMGWNIYGLTVHSSDSDVVAITSMPASPQAAPLCS